MEDFENFEEQEDSQIDNLSFTHMCIILTDGTTVFQFAQKDVDGFYLFEPVIITYGVDQLKFQKPFIFSDDTVFHYKHEHISHAMNLASRWIKRYRAFAANLYREEELEMSDDQDIEVEEEPDMENYPADIDSPDDSNNGPTFH